MAVHIKKKVHHLILSLVHGSLAHGRILAPSVGTVPAEVTLTVEHLEHLCTHRLIHYVLNIYIWMLMTTTTL